MYLCQYVQISTTKNLKCCKYSKNPSARFECHKIFCFKLFNDYFISLRILRMNIKKKKTIFTNGVVLNLCI